jgi:CheY-like chemotaxis protein
VEIGRWEASSVRFRTDCTCGFNDDETVAAAFDLFPSRIMTNAPVNGPEESPRAERHHAKGPQSAPQGDGAARALRILVVDDLVDAADSLATYLRMLGYTVQTAYDGVAALESAAVFCPQVVLLDIALPKLDGYRVAEQLRQREEMQRACLIAVSGYGSPMDVEAAKQAGFDHHFIKPVDLQKLNGVLRTIARP